MITRRTLLMTTCAAALSTPIITVADDKTLRVKLTEADGSPLAKERSRLLIARDLAGDPLPVKISGATVEIGAEPIELAVVLNVPGFGEVYCVADNGGKGYSIGGEIDFVTDAAATRLRRVREAIVPGLPADAEFEERLEAAGHAKTPYESLAAGLHAGERLVLNIAKQRISKLNGPRKGFLFSALASKIALGGPYVQRLKELCNYAPTSWYSWKDEEPAANRIDYARMDQTADWCHANGFQSKVFGYCYMTRGATPLWLQPAADAKPRDADDADAAHGKFNAKWPYERIKAEYLRVIRQTVARYRGKAQFVEVINEAHDKSNLWGLTHEQIVEMTRLTCQAAGGAGMKRVINHCCLWAEYAKRAGADGVRRWSPWRYINDCIKAGTEFETIGLQLYYPQYDLFEIDRMLERFTSFGKSIHVTEMSTSSHDGLDAQSMRPKNASAGWHGPWTEATQADWAEAMYTLCYSKPQFEAVGWWDLADVPGHFWPFGGLLREDMTPKEAFGRVRAMQKSWGFGR